MKLNLSKFKKVKDDAASAVLQHPDGHKITIAKRGLSPSLKQEVESLKLHLDEGGQVSDAPRETTDAPQSNQVASNAPHSGQPTIIINNGQQPAQPNLGNNGFETMDASRQSVLQSPTVSGSNKNNLLDKMDSEDQRSAQMKQFEQQQAANEADLQQKAMQRAQSRFGGAEAPAPATVSNPNQLPELPQTEVPEFLKQPGKAPAAQDPFGMNAYYDGMSQGVQNQIGGHMAEANAMGQLGKQQAQVLQQGLEQKQKAFDDYQTHYKALDQERQNAIQDLKNSHIDPDHYVASMSTSKKITTAIGLILGGMGGGLTGGPNPALEFLKHNIDNDIKSQEANIGNNKTILDANYKQFGNLRDATDMTRIMTGDMITTQLQKAAALSQDPLAKARAQQAIGQIQMQTAPIMQQLAMRRAALGGDSGGQQAQLDPATKIRYLVPENEQKEAFKELQTHQELTKGRDEALRIFDQLQKENTIGNRIMSPIQTSRRTQALRDNLAVEIARDEAGRVNEFEFNAAKQFLPAPGDNDKTTLEKRLGLLNLANKKMNTPRLNAYGILGADASGGGSRYGDNGQKKIQLGPVQLK